MKVMNSVLRVLLVDDNQNDLALAMIAFEEHERSTQVTTCNSGKEALAYLRDSNIPLPNVVVLDLNMPMMSGFEVLEAIRCDPLLQPLTVVILSTSSDPGDIQTAYRLFASSYMVKQQNFGDFMEQIDQFVTYWRRCQFPNVDRQPTP
ncbi:response regulator [Deinococcus sp. 6GRE01]|uniref:response regulator n=1 Tax=Deinococcus sp. 6GRE01 TaxID=2745873 RepID=UPI001E463AA6|nr:response regulator [Deinococcus sp. 6GRE01]MCD0158346.1 response regulator [Deinococcus sp. 6GRE01]